MIREEEEGGDSSEPTFGTPGPGPSSRASAMTIVGPTLATVLTLAVLRAVYTVGTFRARYLTVFTLPTGPALAHT